MRERRLLEHIASMERGITRSNLTDTQLLTASVVNHLIRILNTRQGSVQLDPLFGVPDFTNMAGGLTTGSTRDIEDEIQRMVMRYEPRIKSPKIQMIREGSDVLSIRFSLEATIAADDREVPLQLVTTVNSDGHVEVI